MAGVQPGAGAGKMVGAVSRAAGAGVAEPIRPTTAVPRWPGRAVTPPRVISLPPSSSNHQPSLQSSAPADDGAPQPSSSRPPLPLQEWGQGGSLVEQEVVGADDFWADSRVFGPSPTKEEVLTALSTIQRIFVPVTMQKVFNDGTSFTVDKDVADHKSDTPSTVKISTPELPPVNTDPRLPLFDTKTNRVIDAFRSLHVYPSIKKMVVSLSSDKTVWDAVMRNAAVKEVKRSFFADQAFTAFKSCGGSRSVESGKAKPGDTPDIVGKVVNWILDCTKTMLLTLIDKIWMIAKEVLQLNHGPEVGKKIEVLEEAVRSSFMISVVVFIVVVLFRIHQG